MRRIGMATQLTSEPAAAQSIRLLLGFAIQKVEVALWAKETLNIYNTHIDSVRKTNTKKRKKKKCKKQRKRK